MLGHRAALMLTASAAALCGGVTFVVVAIPSSAEFGTWVIVIVLLGGLLIGTALASRAARAAVRD